MNMNTRVIFFTGIVVASNIFADEAHAQVTFTLRDNQTVADLSSLGGTIVSRRVAAVDVFIGRAESDEEWDGMMNRWVTGPTGRWLRTRVRDGRWEPDFILPRGDKLPNARYNLIALGRDRGGRAVGEQIRITVEVRRKGKG
jgi:hypothetical protein